MILFDPQGVRSQLILTLYLTTLKVPQDYTDLFKCWFATLEFKADFNHHSRGSTAYFLHQFLVLTLLVTAEFANVLRDHTVILAL